MKGVVLIFVLCFAALSLAGCGNKTRKKCRNANCGSLSKGRCRSHKCCRWTSQKVSNMSAKDFERRLGQTKKAHKTLDKVDKVMNILSPGKMIGDAMLKQQNKSPWVRRTKGKASAMMRGSQAYKKGAQAGKKAKAATYDKMRNNNKYYQQMVKKAGKSKADEEYAESWRLIGRVGGMLLGGKGKAVNGALKAGAKQGSKATRKKMQDQAKKGWEAGKKIQKTANSWKDHEKEYKEHKCAKRGGKCVDTRKFNGPTSPNLCPGNQFIRCSIPQRGHSSPTGKQQSILARGCRKDQAKALRNYACKRVNCNAWVPNQCNTKCCKWV